MPADPLSLLLRVDGHAGIGGGHVMRCLALAQACQDAGGRAAFACAELAPSLRQRIAQEGFECATVLAKAGSTADAEATVAAAAAVSARVVAIDGYHFPAAFRQPVHDAGLISLAIDDNGECDGCGDHLILNQNIHAAAKLYPAAAGARLLLGSRYVLLRREFRRCAGKNVRRSAVVRTILVTLGAADSGNATGRVIDALRRVDLAGQAITIVAGGANPHRAAIENASSGLQGARIVNDPGSGMADLIAGADLAITAGGTTMWELSALGVPFVSVVVAENQRLSTQAMTALGFPSVTADRIADELPDMVATLIGDPARRQALSAAGRRLVDGEGASRVYSEIAKLAL